MMKIAMVRYLAHDITKMEVRLVPTEQVPPNAVYVGVTSQNFLEYLVGPSELIVKYTSMIIKSKPSGNEY